MSKELNNIDDFFRIPIEAESEMPSIDVWNAIENKLSKDVNKQLKKKYKNLKRIAAVLLLLLLSSLFFIATKNNKPNFATTTNNNIEKEKTNLSKNEIFKNVIIDTKIELDTNQLIEVIKNNSVISYSNTKNYYKEDEITMFNEKVAISKKINTNTKKIKDNTEEIFERSSLADATKGKLHINIENSYASENEIIDDNNLEQNTQALLKIDNAKKDSIFPKTNLVVKDKIVVTKNKIKMLNKFSVGFYASPEFTFNRLEDNKPHQERTQLQQPNTSRPREDREKIKREENRTTSFSAGILLEYTLNKKISIQSGIGFSSISTEVIPKKIFAEQNAYGAIKYKNNFSLGTTYIDPKLGIVTNVGDSAVLGYSKNTVQYISFPINIMYHYSIGKLTLSPTLGFAANILVKQNAASIVEGANKQNIKSIEGVNNSYFNTNMALEVKYKLHKNIAFICVPKINFALNPLNRNSNVKYYSNTAGLAIGLKYNF
jgi:hypothetical protein